MADETSMHVVRAIAGDQTSAGWLIGHLRGLVEAQIRLRLRGHGSPHDVEDLAADVWVVTLQRLPALVPREGRHAPVLVRFLGTTVLGTCNNFLRRRARAARQRPDTSPHSHGGDPLDHLAMATRGVVSRILEREQTSEVDACLATLAPVHRDVLVLRLMEHRSNQEIADLLAIPANTVAVRYRRALEALRQRLPKHLYAELTGPPGV